MGWKGFASGGLPRAGRDERFASREVRCLAGKFEVAALGAQCAIALDWSGGQFTVHRMHVLQCRFDVRRAAPWHVRSVAATTATTAAAVVVARVRMRVVDMPVGNFVLRRRSHFAYLYVKG